MAHLQKILHCHHTVFGRLIRLSACYLNWWETTIYDTVATKSMIPCHSDIYAAAKRSKTHPLILAEGSHCRSWKPLLTRHVGVGQADLRIIRHITSAADIYRTRKR
jgi:hypothetical protein